MHRSALPFVLAFSPALLAQIPPGYYSSVNTSNAATLRSTLHAVIDDHLRITYTGSGTDTWVVLEQADENPVNAGAIVDVYRNASYTKTGGGVGVYDREHRWPKSYGFPNDGADNYPYTDCHHLILSDSGYNSSRGNRMYANCDAAAVEKVTLLTNGRGGGSGTYPGNSNWTDSITAAGRWETWNARRGDVARAIMYMDVRYEGGTHGVTNVVEPNLVLTDNVALIVASNTGNNENTAYMGLLSTLVQWHQLDPVDQDERNRNDVVYGFQGNRNPFVDHPEWVQCLFSTCGDTVPPAAPGAPSAVVGKATVALDWPDNGEPDLAGYRVFRSASPLGPFTQVNAVLVAASAYVDVGGTDLLAGRYYQVRAVDQTGNVSSASRTIFASWPRNTGPVTPIVQSSPVGVWINEIHYDNAGADTGEFVEVAGAAGTNLSGWRLIAYNGTGGASYATVNLTGSLPAQQNGYGALSFAIAGLQNGAPDGIALVNAANAVVQFLAYEGTFTATDGPASGMTATAIPTLEDGVTPVGASLQLQGAGGGYSAFTWSLPITATPGQINTGQTLQ